MSSGEREALVDKTEDKGFDWALTLILLIRILIHYYYYYYY